MFDRGKPIEGKELFICHKNCSSFSKYSKEQKGVCFEQANT